MNKQVNVPALTKIMQDFARENEKSELTGEMLGDAMDDAMADDNDEEEQERIVGQVLDELGLKMGESVSTHTHLRLVYVVRLRVSMRTQLLSHVALDTCDALSHPIPPASVPFFLGARGPVGYAGPCATRGHGSTGRPCGRRPWDE